ncbi:MAG: peptidylprolyl isomerase [Candidatus Iainarchaeum archaeon]|uniref:Peptidyl-prolyl cis-trans isomerase n=1 Tax=Candidatus Iainarchaeum sp. TaxID=3101447 RepID=A0A7T9DKA4_9ARCH|nr:MAG: peptidylprolyl isomerase [Candidatus Diapherotrites archaeon]
MQKGEIISIEFTGKDVTTGNVFDTTNEELAKKSKIYAQNQKYGPVIVSVGNGEVLPGLDHALQQMKAGETKTVKLTPKDAFGERNPDLVKVLPLNEFKKHNVSAVPGTVVNVNDMHGRVQSVSGGRVRVDFNPDLAGRELEYELKVIKQFSTNEEKAHAIAQKIFPGLQHVNVKINGEKAELHISAQQLHLVQQREATFAKGILDAISSVKKVEVLHSYTQEDFKHLQEMQARGGHYHEDGSYHEGEH